MACLACISDWRLDWRLRSSIFSNFCDRLFFQFFSEGEVPLCLRYSSSSVILEAKACRQPLASFSSLTLFSQRKKTALVSSSRQVFTDLRTLQIKLRFYNKYTVLKQKRFKKIAWIQCHHLHHSNYWRECLLEVIRQNIVG